METEGEGGGRGGGGGGIGGGEANGEALDEIIRWKEGVVDALEEQEEREIGENGEKRLESRAPLRNFN